MNNSDDTYNLDSDDLWEAKWQFAEVISQYNDDNTDGVRIVQLCKKNPFKFYAARRINGAYTIEPVSKEDLEQALYNAGIFVTRKFSEKTKNLIPDSVFKKAECDGLRGVDKIYLENDFQEMPDDRNIVIKEECIIVLYVCIICTMIIGYLTLFYLTARKDGHAGVVLR